MRMSKKVGVWVRRSKKGSFDIVENPNQEHDGGAGEIVMCDTSRSRETQSIEDVWQ